MDVNVCTSTADETEGLRKEPSKFPPKEVGDLPQRHFRFGNASATSRYNNGVVPLTVNQAVQLVLA